jgi:hypothetical protein
VDRRIDLSNLDLDAAHRAIEDRTPFWAASGLVVHPVTWMDNDAEWPQPLLTERSALRRPMSIGVMVHNDEREGEVVLYAGGWADFTTIVTGEDPVLTYVELEDANEFGPLLDRLFRCLTSPNSA